MGKLDELRESLDIDKTITQEADARGIDPEMAKTFARVESGDTYNAKALSKETKAGKAKGVFQLTDATAKKLGVTDPLDYKQNIKGGVGLIAQLWQKYNGDLPKVALAYHSGEPLVDEDGEPGPEGKDYVEKISQRYHPPTGMDLLRQSLARKKGIMRVPEQIKATQQMFPQGLGKTAEERQTQTQMLGQQIEQSQGYPIQKQMNKDIRAGEFPGATPTIPQSNKPEWRQPAQPTGPERMLQTTGEYSGLPTGTMMREGWQYWTNPKMGIGEKLSGMGVGLGEMGKGLMDLHQAYLTHALESSEKAQMATDPFEKLGHEFEVVRNLVGAIPIVGPGTAEAARMAKEGDWAGATGALLGTYIVAPVAYSQAAKLGARGLTAAGRAAGLKPPLTGEITGEGTSTFGGKAERYTDYAQQELTRRGEAGFAGQEKEYPTASFQEDREKGIIYPKPSPEVQALIPANRAERLAKGKTPEQPATPTSLGQAVIATGATVPESAVVTQAMNKREQGMRQLTDNVANKILSYLGGDQTVGGEEAFGERLRAEASNVMEEENRGLAAGARQAGGLPAMPVSPERITETGEGLQGLVPPEPTPGELAAQNEARQQTALAAGGRAVGVQATPEEAGNFIHDLIKGTLGEKKYEQGIVIDGGTERLLGDQAFEAFKEKVRRLPGADAIETTHGTKAAAALKATNDKQAEFVLGYLNKQLGGVVDRLAGIPTKEGTPLPDWNTYYEGYKTLGQALQNAHSDFEKRPIIEIMQAMKKDLVEGLRNAKPTAAPVVAAPPAAPSRHVIDSKATATGKMQYYALDTTKPNPWENAYPYGSKEAAQKVVDTRNAAEAKTLAKATAAAAPPPPPTNPLGEQLATEFEEISNNYHRIAAAARNQIARKTLTSENPLTQEKLVGTVMKSPNIKEQLNGLWESLTARWDPNAMPTPEATEAITKLKSAVWNQLVAGATDKGTEALGIGHTDYSAVVNRLLNDPQYERLFKWSPGMTPESDIYGKLLGYAKAQAEIDAQPPHPEQVSKLFGRLRGTDRAEVIDKLAHDFGTVDAETLRKTLDGDPSLRQLDTEMRFAVVESLMKRVTIDPNTQEIAWKKLQKTLVNRGQVLNYLLPNDEGGLSLGGLRDYVDGVIQDRKQGLTAASYIKRALGTGTASENVLPSLFTRKSMVPWTRVVNAIKDDPNLIRQLILGSWEHLITSNNFGVVGGWGVERQGPGGIGTAPMSYISGVHLYNDYLAGRPKLIRAMEMGKIPKAEAAEILGMMDELTDQAKMHLTTRRFIEGHGGTRALASISSYTQAQASAISGKIPALVGLAARMALRIGFAKYFMGAAKSPFVERFSVFKDAWRSSAGTIKDVIDEATPKEQKSFYRLTALMLPVEYRYLINNLEQGKDADGEPLNPYAPPLMPPMPTRPHTGATP